MHNSEDILRTQAEIDKFEHAKQLADALARLRANVDFKLLIEEAYCTKMQDNLVTSLSMVATEANVQQTVRQLAGIGSLKNFLDIVHNNGEVAARELPALHNALDQLRLGGDDE